MTPDPVPLPRTWRPLGTQIVASVGMVMIVIVAMVFWYAVGAETRAEFNLPQRITLLLLGGVFFAIWFSFMRTKVVAHKDGISIVNGFLTRHFEWSQVLGVTLRRGAPWAGVDLSDGTSVIAFAIQSTDGARAYQAVRELRVLIEAHTPLPPDQR